MDKVKIIADENIPFLKGVLEPYADITYMKGDKINHETVQHADALLIRTRTTCNSSLLKNTAVKFIGTATIGFDHIDTQFCDSKKITWINAPGCNSSSVQQYIASALIELANRYKIRLKGKTLGIIGVGNVGSKVEKIGRALGMNVVMNDPPRARNEKHHHFVPLEVLAASSDIISVHVPLNLSGQDKTKDLINNQLIKIMKPGACLINSSRGEVVNTLAIKQALANGNLALAILDVWEKEPAIDLALLKAVFIGTPHIAGYSTDGKANGTAMVVQAISRKFGFPLNDWYPSQLPVPDSIQIELDGTGKNLEDILAEVLPKTYDIRTDDKNLRSDPGKFEQLRSQYQVRREFTAYTLHTSNLEAAAVKVLADLGFKLIESKK
ncbi:MAG: 4-phosphoerythronate dehydrogenase [Bacteroidetes bacterium]|nr:4-phosphoerythronate dehydrogenase [Bacteroidota bacterium]